MRKIWKALGVAALAAAVVPCKVEKDAETGAKTYHSLLSRLHIGPGEAGEGTEVRLNLLGGLIPSALRSPEEEDFADEEFEDVITEPVFETAERTVPEAEAAEQAEQAEAEAAEQAEAEAAEQAQAGTAEG